MSWRETEVVPFTAEQILGERLLVLAPHPDDEVIGCGGIIAQHTSERRKVSTLIATDGAGHGEESLADRSIREAESIEGLRIVGAPPPLFLRFPDRHLFAHFEELQERLREELLLGLPDLILVPSPIEIHPDHEVLSRCFIELLQQGDEDLVTALIATRVAFYEVSQPIRPNCLVDISKVAETKYRAIEAHRSQCQKRDYTAFARGLNQYRAMTLPPPATAAEALWVTGLPSLRVTPWSMLRRSISSAPR